MVDLDLDLDFDQRPVESLLRSVTALPLLTFVHTHLQKGNTTSLLVALESLCRCVYHEDVKTSLIVASLLQMGCSFLCQFWESTSSEVLYAACENGLLCTARVLFKFMLNCKARDVRPVRMRHALNVMVHPKGRELMVCFLTEVEYVVGGKRKRV